MAAACVCVHLVVCILDFYRVGPLGTAIVRGTANVVVVAQTLLLVVMISYVLHGMFVSYLNPVGLVVQRYVLSALLCVTAGVNIAIHNTRKNVIAAALSWLTLPCWESASPPLFPWLYITAVVGWLIVGIHYLRRYANELRTSVSLSSIKQSIDALPSGISFCTSFGKIVLINQQMQNLVQAITGKQYRNSVHMAQALERGALRPGVNRSRFEGNLLYQFPDGSAWMFTENNVVEVPLSLLDRADRSLLRNVKRLISPLMRASSRQHDPPCQYVQVSAVDVSERWRVAAQVQAQGAVLEEQGAALKTTLANLEDIVRAEAVLRMRTRVHNVLGQRLTLLLHALRESKQPDLTVLQDFAQGLPRSLEIEDDDYTLADKFTSLQAMLSMIGVTLVIGGDWPRTQVTRQFCSLW
jgi:hypothetical protein